MDEYLNLLYDYAARAASITSPEGWTIAGLGCSIIAIVAYFRSQTYIDWAMGKKTMRSRHRDLIERADKALTVVFEDSIKQGHMSREEVDWVYKYIQKGCPKFKELGVEPSYGKPWYTAPAVSSSTKEVKGRIYQRLFNMGKTSKEIWDGLKTIRLTRVAPVTVKSDHEAFVDSIKKHRKVA